MSASAMNWPPTMPTSSCRSRRAVVVTVDVPLREHCPSGGLANGSGQVGRNYMRHNNSALMAVSREPNDTTYQKTMALNDFYFGADDWEYPLGGIQTPVNRMAP